MSGFWDEVLVFWLGLCGFNGVFNANFLSCKFLFFNCRVDWTVVARVDDEDWSFWIRLDDDRAGWADGGGGGGGGGGCNEDSWAGGVIEDVGDVGAGGVIEDFWAGGGCNEDSWAIETGDEDDIGDVVEDWTC